MKRSSSSENKSVSKKVISNGKVSKKEVKLKFEKKTTPSKKSKKSSPANNSISKGKKLSAAESVDFSSKLSHNKSGKPRQDQKPEKKNQFGKKTDLLKKKGLVKKKGKEGFELNSKLIGKDGKPAWNKVKEEKKKLREDRKLRRTGADQYQLSVKAKKIWEKLRIKNFKEVKKEALVNDLFMLLKGQIANVVHSHDMARVVQCMLKHGSVSVKTAICEDLCADVVSYLQSKFASFCVKSALRNGSKSDQNHLIQSCTGHFLKLIGHSYAHHVVETMYDLYASAEQRRQMHREMYGEMHSLLPAEVTAINNISDDIRPAVLIATKANLTKLLAKKQLLKSKLIQSVLNDFLSSCSSQDCNDVLELIQGDILELLDTKEGSRVALQVVWNATNKMKKVIVKELKGKVKDVAMSETGHILLLALFDCVDDTVLVKKALVPEMLESAEELSKNEWGRKVILYLVAHRDPSYFHPQQIEILSKGDSISSRKKDTSVREKEMLEAVSDPLLQRIAGDPRSWLEDSSVAMVSLAIMKSGKGEALQKVFEQLVEFLLEPGNMVEVNNRQFHVVELSWMNIIFKKLIQQDQTQPDRTKDSFSIVLASRLTEESLNHLLRFNRGCFLLVLLFESNNNKVCKILRSKMTESLKELLCQQETTGSKILLKKLVKDE